MAGRSELEKGRSNTLLRRGGGRVEALTETRLHCTSDTLNPCTKNMEQEHLGQIAKTRNILLNLEENTKFYHYLHLER